MPPRVVIVGSFNQDLTWRCARFPVPGATTVGDFSTGPGGKGSNQAVAAARAGGRTTFVGALGRDAFGLGAARFLRREGIAARIAWKTRPTGNAAILVDASGQNQIVVTLGANAALAPRDVPAAVLRGARVVVCQHETDLRTNAHVLRTARRLGVTTVLNPAPMRPDFDPALLRHVDVLIPNETEFAALAAIVPACRTARLPGKSRGRAAAAGTDLPRLPADALQKLCRALGVPVVIVTLGARGCFVSQPDGGVLLPAPKVRVVDTTGAGDAFVGALAAALTFPGTGMLTAARFALAAASLSVTRRGAAPSMPRRAAILASCRRLAAKGR